jgi:hypothetical protein
MFIKSSLLALTFVFVSIGSTIAAEVPAIQNSAWEPQPELIATESDPANNWKIRYELPIVEVLQSSSNIAQAAETSDSPTIAPPMPTSTETPLKPNSTPTEPKKWAVGVHAQAATTGFFGFDAGYKFSPNLHARLGLNTGGFKYNLNSENIDYNASFQPTNIHLLGDYFPFGGGLRLTGGLVIQNNRFTATAKSKYPRLL